MDQQFDFRALLIKLQDCLSADDRRRLHFLVGDMIPRQIRDDPTLGGTLHLLESLFDQGRINTEDFGYLIHAFRQIGCHTAVQRLKEHQRSENSSAKVETSIDQLIDDNAEDKITYIEEGRNLMSLDKSSPSNGRHRSSGSAQSVNGAVNARLRHLGQSIRSRLTICQVILFVMNLIGIISFLIISKVIKKPCIPHREIMLGVVGNFYGDKTGGQPFDDATDCSLNFTERITKIKSGWTNSEIKYITFTYSNGKSMRRGGASADEKATYLRHDEFKLNSNESIDVVTVYTGTRPIPNLYKPNGTLIVVGLRFYTSRQRESVLFGSSDGDENHESFRNHRLGYIYGRAEGYIDAIQFIWYNEAART